MFQWIVVGVGDITTKRVIPAIQSEERSRLAALVTRDPAKAQSYGVPAFTSLEEALAVFDSALRDGLRRREVTEAALSLGKLQRRRVLAVARVASRRAANPFESVLRALAIEAAEALGAHFEPQHRIQYDDFYARVDLGSHELRIVMEAESFEFHGDKAALARDCVRYTELGSRGWLVLRFSYEHVMTQPDFVRRVTTDVVLRAERMREVGLRVVPAA